MKGRGGVIKVRDAVLSHSDDDWSFCTSWGRENYEFRSFRLGDPGCWIFPAEWQAIRLNGERRLGK